MAQHCVRILGIDPGLRNMGWGIIDHIGSRIVFVASGSVHSEDGEAMGERLLQLFCQLQAIVELYCPIEAAVEETFVNRDPQSALKLGQARGIALLAPASRGLPVAEYAANLIKKTVVGNGHAQKDQIAMMVRVLLPQCSAKTVDAFDALAVAITHAQHRGIRKLRAAL